MKRILMAAFTGCITLFIWGAVSHMVLFTGAGFTPLPDEDTIISTLEHHLPKQGLYFFPGKDFKHTTAAQEAVFAKKFETGPVGMIIYRPVGGTPVSVDKLLIQFASNFITTLIIAFILSYFVASYRIRVLAAASLGALACASVSTIYWNWYEFPYGFFLAQCVDQVTGCLLAGLVIAAIVPPPLKPNNN